jgi:hypothetical protein
VIAQTYEEAVPLERLTPSPENVNEGDVGAIAESIQTNGFYGSVIAQRSSGTIIAGEHRWRAAQATGGETVPVIWLDVDDEQARRIRLVDNRTTRLGRDDPAALADLLRELSSTSAGLAGTGFDGDDLDDLCRALALGETDPNHEWVGMPAYENDNKNGAFTVTIHCVTDEDADELFRLLDRPRSRSLFWPADDGHVGSSTRTAVVFDE